MGKRIRARRLELGWTQEELATKARVSAGYISDLENDKRSVGAETLLDLSEALGVSLDYLMKGEEIEASERKRTIEIPRDLADVAIRIGLSFRQARQLLGMREQIIAHRTEAKSGQDESFDWQKFYESVKKYLL